jgi:hypothetical protein
MRHVGDQVRLHLRQVYYRTQLISLDLQRSYQEGGTKDVRALRARDYEKAKQDARAVLVRLNPRYQNDVPIPPLPTTSTTPDGTTPAKSVASLSKSDYERAKVALKKSLTGFAGMKTSPGLYDDTPRTRQRGM